MFSEHWQKTHEGYCSVIETNLIIEIEAWLEKSVFRFKVEKFERRMNSNFEQQNQILILGQNAWPGLTVMPCDYLPWSFAHCLFCGLHGSHDTMCSFVIPGLTYAILVSEVAFHLSGLAGPTIQFLIINGMHEFWLEWSCSCIRVAQFFRSVRPKRKNCGRKCTHAPWTFPFLKTGQIQFFSAGQSGQMGNKLNKLC